MATTTQVAAALDALVAVARRAVPADVTVIDGQPVKINQKDVIVVGFSASGPAVEMTQDFAGVSGGRSERMSIACLASSYRGGSGEDKVRLVRARTVEMLDLLTDALELDASLGGAVERAEFGTAGALDQAQTKDGPSATVEFTVLAEVL